MVKRSPVLWVKSGGECGMFEIERDLFRICPLSWTITEFCTVCLTITIKPFRPPQKQSSDKSGVKFWKIDDRKPRISVHYFLQRSVRFFNPGDTRFWAFSVRTDSWTYLISAFLIYIYIIFVLMTFWWSSVLMHCKYHMWHKCLMIITLFVKLCVWSVGHLIQCWLCLGGTGHLTVDCAWVCR